MTPVRVCSHCSTRSWNAWTEPAVSGRCSVHRSVCCLYGGLFCNSLGDETIKHIARRLAHELAFIGIGGQFLDP